MAAKLRIKSIMWTLGSSKTAGLGNHQHIIVKRIVDIEEGRLPLGDARTTGDETTIGAGNGYLSFSTAEKIDRSGGLDFSNPSLTE